MRFSDLDKLEKSVKELQKEYDSQYEQRRESYANKALKMSNKKYRYAANLSSLSHIKSVKRHIANSKRNKIKREQEKDEIFKSIEKHGIEEPEIENSIKEEMRKAQEQEQIKMQEVRELQQKREQEEKIKAVKKLEENKKIIEDNQKKFEAESKAAAKKEKAAKKTNPVKKFFKRMALVGASVLAMVGITKPLSLNADEKYALNDAKEKDKKDEPKKEEPKENLNTFASQIKEDVVTIGNYNYHIGDPEYSNEPQLGASREDTAASNEFNINRTNNDNAVVAEANKSRDEKNAAPAPAPEISEDEKNAQSDKNQKDDISINPDGSTTKNDTNNTPAPEAPSEGGIGENPDNIQTGTGGEVIIEVPEDKPQELPPLDVPEYVTPPEYVEEGYTTVSPDQSAPDISIIIEENDATQPSPQFVEETDKEEEKNIDEDDELIR